MNLLINGVDTLIMNLFNFGKKTIFQRFWLGVSVWIVSFLFYLKTLAPTVVWGDSAKLAVFAYIWRLDYTPGNHPLHSLIGALFNLIPIGNIAFRQNLMSAFFGSLAVFLLYLVIFKITNSRLSSICGALSLMVSHTFWHLAVINETYSLLSFFFILLILILLTWQKSQDNRLLYLFFFLFGLSISNNELMIFFMPAYIIYFLCCRQNKNIFEKKNVFFMFISFLLGSSLLIFLIISKYHNLTQVLFFTIAIPFKRYYRPIHKMVLEFIKYPIYLLYQFPIFGFLLGLKGMRRFFKLDKRLFLLLLIISIISICFASGYMRQKQFYLLVPTYLVFAIFIGIGFNSIKNNFRKAIIFLAMVCLPILLYYNMPFIVDSLNIDLIKARSLPYRDNNRFFLLPDKSNYFGAYLYGKEVLETVEPDSIIIIDFTPFAVINYLRIVENKSCNAKIVFDESIDIPEFIAKNIDNYTIYLADLEPYYDIINLRKKYNIIPKGLIFQVIKEDN